ncbi:STAS domain-containing protein [Variovorax sp. VNK109]|jgi:phospholipid transport system transporter-binding protein|uniref:STAS domain-containing protein n=1 Tax=Variovorax sp. VNK109 TaxID=3400919 RepID=UPI003C0EF5CE
MLVLPACLTHDEATACSRMLRQALQREADGTVVVDASPLQEFDSSAIAVLLETRREALEAGKAFAVSGLPERLRSLAGLYGVAGLLPAAA